jgi:hypothetical protein
MKYKVIDNFLDNKDFRFVYDQITGNEFPWFFQKESVISNNDNDITDSFFTHVFFKNNEVNSNYYEHFKFIIDAIGARALIRFKANCYPPTEEIKIHMPHTDHEFEHNGFLLYVNDNDGYTILEDGTKIESVANRALFFDASRPHQSTTATNVKARFNININYL